MNQTELKNTLSYLNWIYDWSDEDKREIWMASVNNAEMCCYWKRLEKAHRCGYRQTAENGYMRLVEFERTVLAPYQLGKIGADVISELIKQAEEIDERTRANRKVKGFRTR